MPSPSSSIFTRGFVTGTLVNLALYVNYYTLMVVMANFSMATYAVDLSTAGFSASIFIVGALIARFVSPPIIGSIGRKRTLVLGLAMMTVASALYLLNAGIVMLFAVRLLHGFFYGLAQTTVTGIATESVPDEHKGEGIGYYMLSVTVGSAIGPFLGTSLMHGPGFAAMFVVCTVVAALGLVGAISVRSNEGKAAGTQGARTKDENSQPDANTMASADGTAASTMTDSVGSGKTTAAPTENAGASPSPKRALSLSTFIEVSALPISFVVVLVYLGYGAVITYLNAFAAEENLTAAAGVFFVAYAVAMLISRPFTGKAFDRHGDLPVMTSGFFAFVAGLVVIGSSANDPMLLAGACLMGYGIGTIQPSGLTLAVRRAANDRFDVANSTFFICLDAAIGLCPILLGWTVGTIGYRGLFILLGAVAGVAFFVYLALRKRGLIG